MYLKDRLSERRPRRAISFPLVMAVLLIIVATVLAIVFSRSGSPENTAEKQSAPKAGSAAKPADRVEEAADGSVGEAQSGGAAQGVGNSAIVGLLRESEELVAAEDLLAAREKLLQVLKSSDNPVALGRARKVLDRINVELLLSPRQMPGKIEYIVQPGDSLDRIARKHGVNVELIQKSNDIRGALIHPGQRLRIPAGKFSIVADKSDNLMMVYYNGEYFKTYRIGTGKYDKTPVGESKVTDRIMHPTWWQPDGKAIPYGSPDNLLGTHWLALDIRGYGIHGTWEPETIGRSESEGCIRMLNSEVEELFNIIPVGTPVTIKD